VFLLLEEMMKKRRYVDLYGYTLDEFDSWLESAIDQKLRSARKSRSELDMPTVFAAYKDEARKQSCHKDRIG
jgi:hypothetical protein